MKANLRNILLIVTVLCLDFVYGASADDLGTPAGNFYNLNMTSPHVADMFRYGEFGTSLFTGRMQQTIPIYTLDDPDFKMNIALHYNAEGFKPRKHSGYVGYNWFLEAGGCITREVSGLPDEIYGHRAIINGPKYGYGVEGMYHFAKNHPIVDKDYVFNLPNATDEPTCLFNCFNPMTTCHNVGNECDYEVDYMPDIFRFNFMGYSGTFMIGNAGKVQIVSGDFVNVDLSGILEDNWEPISFSDSPSPYTPGIVPYPKENSTITIKTNDGYTYIFGGDVSKLEYTLGAYNHYSWYEYELFNRISCFEANSATVSTWYLAEIIAPNGRTMNFHYKPAKEGVGLLSGIPGGEDPLWVFNEFSDKYVPYYNVCKELSRNAHSNSSDVSEYLCKMAFYETTYEAHSRCLCSMTKTCIIDSIVVSGQQPLKIVFDNSLETKKMYDDVYYNICRHNYQLNAIRIQSSGKTIKRADLTYTHKSSSKQHGTGSYASYNWRFLESAKISGIGKYLMDYDDGYYPILSEEDQSPYDPHLKRTSLTDDYGYSVGSSSLGLLEKIIFPAGGFQTYSYTGYSYDKIRRYRMEGTNLIMETIDEDRYYKYKYGSRIFKVITYDKDGRPIETKSYDYKDGIYYDNLRVYGLVFYGQDLWSEQGWLVRSYANYGMLDTHIGYGQVTETTTNSKGSYKTVYKFDLGEESYDLANDKSLNAKYFCDDNKFGVVSGLMFYGCNLRKWGKVMSVEHIDSEDKLVRSISYTYNNIPDKTSSFIHDDVINGGIVARAPQIGGLSDGILSQFSSSRMCIDTIVIFGRYNSGYMGVIHFGGPKGHSIPAGAVNVAEIARKLFIYPDVLTKEIIKEGNLTTTKTYTYDKKLRVKKETITDSRDIEHFTKYTYPDNISKASNIFEKQALGMMVQANRINTPVETVSGYVSGNKDYITSGSINLYGTEMYVDVTQQGAQRAPSAQSPVTIGSVDFHFRDSFNIVDWSDQSLGYMGYYPYLSKTLSLTMTEPITDYQPMRMSGSNVSYDGRYKLDAEYKFSQQGRLLSIKPFGQMETKYTWDGIYPATKTIGNQTWKYSFIPHVGVKEIVDPRGIITRYEYDSAGRLIKESQVIDGKEQVLNVYQYHIITE